jgi:hypothetical protein
MITLARGGASPAGSGVIRKSLFSTISKTGKPAIAPISAPHLPVFAGCSAFRLGGGLNAAAPPQYG